MLVGVLVAGLLSVLMVTMAHAVTTTINTNDGLVDPNWTSVTLFQDDANNDGTSNAEINKVWMTNNSALNAFYFRVDSLVQLPNDEWLTAKLDCDRNGSYADAADVAVVMDVYEGAAFECQGNTYNDTCYPNNYPTSVQDDNGPVSAEMIAPGGGTYTYEWSGSTAGNVNWSACLGTIKVQFAAVFFGNDSSEYAEDDTTAVREYHVPTAIQLQRMTASTSTGGPAFVLAAAVVILLGSAWMLRH